MVVIGGDIAFAREDWLVGLGAEEHEEHLERLWAWGKQLHELPWRVALFVQGGSDSSLR
jgi:hypothetical protein